MNNLTKITANGIDFKVGNPIQVTWDSSSNMDNFKEPGVYEIYGERTRQDDNLPILNASSGHSIAARLTVIASTLQPANNEICVTQFLMLSNRKGGDGNMYVRTFNDNNSPAANWWTPWQKLQGIREGYIFTNTVQVNPDGGVQEIDGVTGLNNMVDNGIYSGIYTDDYTFQTPTFIDTFTLIVINNYAVAGQDQRLKRTISQLKYAVDAITNQVSVKQRTKTDGDDNWSDWKNIGGGGETVIDATPMFEMAGAYGLPGIINSEYKDMIQPNVTYELTFGTSDGQFPVLDPQNKIRDHFRNKWILNTTSDQFLADGVCRIKNVVTDIGQVNLNRPYDQRNGSGLEIEIIAGYTIENPNKSVIHYKYTLGTGLGNIKVSSDYTDLE